MKSTITFFRRFALALLVAGVVSACDSPTSALQDDATGSTDTIALLSAELTADLSLSADQQSAMDQTISRFGDGDANEPGFLWRLAAQLSDELTDEQKEALFAKAAARATGERPTDAGFGDRSGTGGPGMGGPGGGGPGGDRGGMGGSGMGGPGGDSTGDHQVGSQGGDRQGGLLDGILTDEQKAAVEAIQELHKDAIQTAAENLKNADATTRETLRAELKAAHDALRTEVEAFLAGSLTADQQAAIDAIKADREAARATAQAAERLVMIDVLGIDDTTADGVKALQETFRDAVADARLANESDPEAIGAAVAAAAVARDAAVNDALAGSTVGQAKAFEIYRIHDVIQKRAQHHRASGRRGGPGSGGAGGPGSGGPGSGFGGPNG